MKYIAFSDNSDFYKSLLRDIKGAKKKIYIETYIYRDDELGREIRDLLTLKAGEKVDVRLLIDAIGSVSLSELNFTDLLLAGGQVKFFRRLLLMPFHLAKINNRDHRKIVMIDDDIAYIGSTNIDKETYSWREFNLRIQDRKFNEIFSKIFIQQSAVSNALVLDGKKDLEKYVEDGIEILRSVPFRKNPFRNALFEMILSAKKEIIIENPYIVCDKKLLRFLRRSAKDGVEVKVLIPTISDINMMGFLNKKFMVKVRKMGMQVYLYPKMFHSKVFLVDGKSWMFGSANLDFRSLFNHFEIMLRGDGGEVGALVKKHIDAGLAEIKKNGREFDGQITFKEKLWGNLLYPLRFLF